MYSGGSGTMTFQEYVEEELKYYDEHPEEDDLVIEAHSNASLAFEVDYTTQA